jgi:hypothetical protein
MVSHRRALASRIAVAAATTACGVSPGCGSSAQSDSASFAGTHGAAGASADAGAPGNDAASCPFGQTVCAGDFAYRCASGGQRVDPVDCRARGQVCADALGCVACVPGTGSCSDGRATLCAADGSSLAQFDCDPVQGMSCLASGCTGACTPANLGQSHVGCDFWPTVTANNVWSQWFAFGVMIVNTSASEAHATLTRGASAVAQVSVPPEGFALVELPWVAELKGPDAHSNGAVIAPSSSVLATAGAFRLRSDQPVVAVQMSATAVENPQGLAAGCPELGTGRCLSYSNDASLLLPATSLTRTYVAVGWHSWPMTIDPQGLVAMGDLVTVTATRDATSLEVVPAGAALEVRGDALAAPVKLTPGAASSFTLERGDVLELFSDGRLGRSQLAGSLLTASQPVMVLSGAPCVNVPDDTVACDHLEEIVVPRNAFGTAYVVATPLTPGGVSRHLIRAHALEDDTALSFDPPSVHGPVTLRQGESVEVETDRDAFVTCTRPFALTQYLLGHGGGAAPNDGKGAGQGDPSQSFAVPQAGYLKDYVFATPPGFPSQVLAVIAPTGAVVTLDGSALDSKAFTAVGASGLSVARVVLEPGARHRLQGERPIGAQLFGYGPFTSFAFPLGIALRSPSSR